MSFHDRHIGSRVMNALYSSGAINRLRERIVPLAGGIVVELGSGAGRNLPYYDRVRVKKLIAVHPPGGAANPSIFKRDGAGLDIEQIAALPEVLPLDDASADSVVVTYGFCATPDASAAMREARRVLKPGGQLLLCEHGRAQTSVIASLQDRLNPLWRPLTQGCNLNLDVGRMLHRAGFNTDMIERVYLRGMPRILGAHHFGIARAV